MISQAIWQQIIETISGHDSFIIVSHMNPDCDALGSELALAEHLLAFDKQVHILNSDATPDDFQFLDSHNLIQRYEAAQHKTLIMETEVIIVLDASGGWQRVGRIGKALSQAKGIKLCIDHHPDAADFVDVAAIDVDAAATAELIYKLVRDMSGVITPTMAQALYAAIITDTGNFRFPKTSPTTHHIAAALLEAGANPLHIYDQLYQQASLGRVRLKGHILDSIQTEVDGQLAYYSVDRKTLKQYKLTHADLDGFAGLAQEIDTVRVALFFVENSKRKVKVSLRSDGSIAINQIAAAYEGGGHASAAGALIQGSLEEVVPEVVNRVKALLLSENGSTP